MFSIIGKFKNLLNKKQKIRIFIIMIMMIIGGFLEMLGVSLILPLVSAIMKPDIIITNKYAKIVCETFNLHSYRTFMIVIIGALIAVFIIKNVFLLLQYYVQYRFVYNNRFSTQVKLLQAYINRPYEYYFHASTGEIMRVVQGDTAGAFKLLTTLLNLFTELAISTALIITIFVVDPVMTLCIGIILGALMLLTTRVIRPLLRNAGISQQKNSGLSNKWLLQSVNGIKELKVMKKEDFFVNNFQIYGKKSINAEKKNDVLGAVPRLLIESISICAMLSIIALFIYKGRDLETMIPSLSAFAMAAVRILPSANRIVAALNSLSFQEPSLDKLIENLNTLDTFVKTNEKDDNKKRKLTLNERIELSNITYMYPESEAKILKEVSITIPIGASVGVIGASGAGKTTVVDILLGLLKPQEGRVLTDGVDIQENYQDWLTHIGYIPQMIFLMDDSIKANVAFGFMEKDIDEDRVWKALSEAKLDDFVRELPEGLDTRIGERGVRLSGGQRQRIGIARALYTDPEILVFDEATSALDNETETAIMESVNNLQGKKTMIIIAHRLQTIENCDIVYKVMDKKIIREK